MIKVKPWQVLVTLCLIGFFLQSYLLSKPGEIERFRPKEFEKGKEESGSIKLFVNLVFLTAFLVFLKVFGFKLEYIIDFSVFLTGFYGGLLFGFPEMGFLLLALRKIKEIWAFNISSALSILFFALIFGPFVTPKAVFLLMLLLSLYDVIGVLYLPYIKFLWLQVDYRKIMQGIAVITEHGTVGAGDFALPLLFFLSFKNPASFILLPFFVLAFEANRILSREFGPMPGLPLITALASIPYFFLGL